MRKTVQACLLILGLMAAVLLMMDSFSVVKTGTGNGATIQWDDNFERFCCELAKGCSSDAERVTVFRNWIIQNISYDEESEVLFYQTFHVGKVMQSKKGVCFDYACLFAAMCRSQGIPCYVLDGTYQGEPAFRHAWNRGFFDGQWWSLDTTRDHTARKEGGSEYGVVPIGEDPFAEDSYFLIHQVF